MATGLGKGLSALLGDDTEELHELDKMRGTREVPIDLLQPNPYQPRTYFDEEALAALQASIEEKGILEPLLVRRIGDSGEYEIIAGERRWRAAQRARLHEVPVVVKELSDVEALEVAIIENIQREDLSPMEEARGYQRLMDEFSYTQEQMAQGVGKSRSHVANMLRLLKLPESVMAMVDEGQLSMGHARALLTADDPEGLAAQIVRDGLNVRQAEKLAKKGSIADAIAKQVAATPKSSKDADTIALEGDLTANLGMKVSINFEPSKGGDVRIAIKSLDDLDRLCQVLSSVVD